MITAGRETSREVYRAFGSRFREQKETLRALYKERGTLTDKEAAAAMGIPANTVSARRNELMKEGEVMLDRKRRCAVTGLTVCAWKLVYAETLF